MSESIQPALPVHPVPDMADPVTWLLTVSDGVTELSFDRTAVAALPHVDLEDVFTCLEGWSTGALHWRGVRVFELLNRLPSWDAKPYLAISAPDARAVIPLSEVSETSILADALNGAPLPREHGGPYRFVVPGAACYNSLKWVQRIELCATAEGQSAYRAARQRLESR